MRLKTKIKTKLLALVLTIAALATGHVTATAQVGTFTVTNTSGSTFTITRTTNTDATEKVMYRTVSLSAIEGTHFTAVSGTLTFDADNNHAPIGVHGTYQHFFGSFDGDGHTVSGIRISSSTDHQGLFGYLSGATVTRDGNSNCTNYGGIVGKTNGTISNCIADGTWVNGSEESSSGAIVGTNDGGTLAHNNYYDCSVKSFGNNVGTGGGDFARLSHGDKQTAVLDAVLTSSEDGSRYVLAVVNKDPKQEAALAIDFASMGKKTPKQLNGWVLSVRTPDDYNDRGDEHVRPERQTLRVKNGRSSESRRARSDDRVASYDIYQIN